MWGFSGRPHQVAAVTPAWRRLPGGEDSRPQREAGRHQERARVQPSAGYMAAPCSSALAVVANFSQAAIRPSSLAARRSSLEASRIFCLASRVTIT
jgi:hypothetical protein